MFLVGHFRRVIAMHWHAMFVRRTTTTAILRRCRLAASSTVAFSVCGSVARCMVLLLVRFVTHGYSSGLLFPLGNSFRSCAVHLFYQHVRVPSACFLLPLPALRRVRASAGLADAATGSKTGSSRARARFLGRRCVRHRSSSSIHLYALRRAMPRQGQHRHSQ